MFQWRECCNYFSCGSVVIHAEKDVFEEPLPLAWACEYLITAKHPPRTRKKLQSPKFGPGIIIIQPKSRPDDISTTPSFASVNRWFYRKFGDETTRLLRLRNSISGSERAHRGGRRRNARIMDYDPQQRESPRRQDGLVLSSSSPPPSSSECRVDLYSCQLRVVMLLTL